MLAYHHADADACAVELSKVWNAVWKLLDSSDPSTRKAAAASLATLGQCFTPSLISAAIAERTSPEPKSVIGKIISQVTKSFGTLAFARAIPDILAVTSSHITNHALAITSNGTEDVEENCEPALGLRAEECYVLRCRFWGDRIHAGHFRKLFEVPRCQRDIRVYHHFKRPEYCGPELRLTVEELREHLRELQR